MQNAYLDTTADYVADIIKNPTIWGAADGIGQERNLAKD